MFVSLHAELQCLLQVFIVLVLCRCGTALAFVLMVLFQEALLLDVLHHNLFFRLLLCRFLPLLSLLLRLELTLRGAREMPRIIQRGLLDAW